MLPFNNFAHSNNNNATMAMNFSLVPFAIFIIALLFLFSPSFCLLNPPNNFRGLRMEEKTRLGSTPPTCHNKCNQCHPCMAVQVPTIPSHNRVDPVTNRPVDYFDTSGPRYSNYKPLGWKCRCGGNFFNP